MNGSVTDRLRLKVDMLNDALEMTEHELQMARHQIDRQKRALREQTSRAIRWRERARDAEAQQVGKISSRPRRKVKA